MDDIIKQLEACHIRIANRLRQNFDTHDYPVPRDIRDVIDDHRALIDRLQAKPDTDLLMCAKCGNVESAPYAEGDGCGWCSGTFRQLEIGAGPHTAKLTPEKT